MTIQHQMFTDYDLALAAAQLHAAAGVTVRIVRVYRTGKYFLSLPGDALASGSTIIIEIAPA